MRLYVHLGNIVSKARWQNFFPQCEILWFPECGPRSWDFGRRLWEQSWSEMLKEGWLPCCDILSSPWVSSQVGLSNIYRTFLSQQMVPLVQTSAWKLWKRQLRHWRKEACYVLSHPTLAIRYPVMDPKKVPSSYIISTKHLLIWKSLLHTLGSGS